jgi:hypothetical protein
LPFQSLDLSKKLSRECRLAPKALITRIASQAQVHVAHSRFEGSPENTQLLFVQFEQHRCASTLLAAGPGEAGDQSALYCSNRSFEVASGSH